MEFLARAGRAVPAALIPRTLHALQVGLSPLADQVEMASPTCVSSAGQPLHLPSQHEHAGLGVGPTNSLDLNFEDCVLHVVSKTISFHRAGKVSIHKDIWFTVGALVLEIALQDLRYNEAFLQVSYVQRKPDLQSQEKSATCQESEFCAGVIGRNPVQECSAQAVMETSAAGSRRGREA